MRINEQYRAAFRKGGLRAFFECTGMPSHLVDLCLSGGETLEEQWSNIKRGDVITAVVINLVENDRIVLEAVAQAVQAAVCWADGRLVAGVAMCRVLGQDLENANDIAEAYTTGPWIEYLSEIVGMPASELRRRYLDTPDGGTLEFYPKNPELDAWKVEASNAVGLLMRATNLSLKGREREARSFYGLAIVSASTSVVQRLRSVNGLSESESANMGHKEIGGILAKAVPVEIVKLAGADPAQVGALFQTQQRFEA